MSGGDGRNMGKLLHDVAVCLRGPFHASTPVRLLSVISKRQVEYVERIKELPMKETKG